VAGSGRAYPPPIFLAKKGYHPTIFRKGALCRRHAPCPVSRTTVAPAIPWNKEINYIKKPRRGKSN